MSAILKVGDDKGKRDRLNELSSMLHQSYDSSRCFREHEIEEVQKEEKHLRSFGLSSINKSHFSPQTSMKIRIIDETDTDY